MIYTHTYICYCLQVTGEEKVHPADNIQGKSVHLDLGMAERHKESVGNIGQWD